MEDLTKYGGNVIRCFKEKTDIVYIKKGRAISIVQWRGLSERPSTFKLVTCVRRCV